MLAKKLEVVVYPDAGPSWQFDNRTWELIENAVRDLDRAECPFLHIYLQGGRGKSALWLLNVIGGSGEYGIFGTSEDWQERWRFRDKSRPKGPNLVDIWVTDQRAPSRKRICPMILVSCSRFANDLLE